jgi:hypothetical protein
MVWHGRIWEVGSLTRTGNWAWRLAALLMVLVGFGVGAPADARAADPLPFASLTPADGASMTVPPLASNTYFSVKLQADTNLQTWLSGEVSTSPLPGVDGTLADDFRVDSFTLFESDAFPGTWTGTSYGNWQRTPGTYYWQFQMQCYWNHTSCGGSGACCDYRMYMSPVRRIVITAPPAAPPAPPSPPANPPGPPPSQVAAVISGRDVRRYVSVIIRDNTSGRVRSLSRTCSGAFSRNASCYLTWRIGRYRFQGTARFRHFLDGGETFWSFRFSGSKKKIGCHACKTTRLRWH